MLLEELMKITEQSPDNLALLSENEKVTYRELLDLSRKVAHKLSCLQIGKGDFVTIELPRSSKYVAASLGVWMVNAAFAALDNTYPADRLAFIAADCRAKIRIADSFFENIGDEPLIRDICHPDENDYSLLVYTSGSTGRPKGVLHTHLSLTDSSVRAPYSIGAENFKRKGEIVGLPVPFSFVAGLNVLFGGMVCGLIPFIIPYLALRDPAIMSRIIYENNISIAYIPPKMIKVLENKGGVLKTIITGSEKVTNTFRKDVDIYNSYGASEVGGTLTSFAVDREYENTPIGHTIGKEKIYILDEDGNEVNEGEMCIAGHFAAGYHNLPEETAEHFVPNPFKDRDGFDIMYKTGDIVTRTESSDIVYINRKDWMIKINGQRVEPGEIEHTIRMADNVVDAAVTSFTGAAGQTYIAAYYTVKDGTEVREEDIKKVIGDTLPAYMMPAYFIRMESLPLNANGKLDRKALKAPEIAASAEYIAPGDEIEKELCEAFEKALNLPRIGIKDDFFALGGDSIRVMVLEQLCPKLKLSTKMIYEKRTVEQIAEAVRNSVSAAPETDIHGGSFPLNQAQLGIFLSCEQREGEIAYNNPLLLRFSKDVDVNRLQAAVNRAIHNHPGLLAAIFVNDQGLPEMKYSEDFAQEEGCAVYQIREKDLEQIRDGLVKPFYVKKERLFRFAIYQSEEAVHLFMDIHHIMYDGYSMKVLLPEIIDLYHGKEVEPESFTAYHAALRESQERKSDYYDRAREWYLNEFGDVTEVTLPQGDMKGNETVFMEYKTSLDIDPDMLRTFCLDHQLTENAVTTAAFGCLLSIYAMNRTAAFATVYNGRHDAATANTVSMFVRTLPVLCRNDASLTVVDYIRKVKDQMLGAMANDSYSFRELVGLGGYSSDVLFTYQGDLFEIPDWGDMRAAREDLPFNATGEKLSIQLFPADGKLVFDVQYHANLYSESWVRDFVDRYQRVLKSFLRTMRLKDVSLVSPEERQAIIDMSYGGSLEYDGNQTFIDQFLAQAGKDPDKAAVIDTNSSYTYRELDSASDAIARYLIAQGVNPGDFVALRMGRVKEFCASVIGVQKAGAAYVPIDPEYPEDRIEYIVCDCEAKVTLTKELVGEILSGETCGGPVNLAKPALPAYMIYTSGSTGMPKGVVISHRALSCFLAWNRNDFGMDENNVHAHYVSFSFDASVFDLFPSLANGSQIHIISEEIRKDLDMTYRYYADHGITNVCMSTQVGMALLNLHPDVPLKFIHVGGEKFHQVKKTNVRIVNGYGPTEFTVCSSYQIVDQDSDREVPIGKAVKNTWSFVCDINGNLLPPGMAGEICLAGPQLSEGYFRREELNKERFVECRFLKNEKMYRTGDLARYNEDGLLEYIGRMDFQVKLRGFRIEPGEIENAAAEYPNVKQTIVLVKDRLLVLYYTGEGEIDEEALKAYLSGRLPAYMVPDVMMRLEKMPLNTSGKIDRRALPEPEKTGRETVPPRTEEEKKVFDLLAGILGYDDFGVLDDFAEIGMTSLSAMQFASLLSTAMNRPVRVNDLVKYPTVSAVTEFLLMKEEASSHEIREDYPLTMVQHGILTEVMAHPDTTVYNIPFVMNLPQGTDLHRFEDAVRKAIDAHPYLKGRIITNQEGEFRIRRNDEAEIGIQRIESDSLKGGPQELVRPFDLMNDILVRAVILTGPQGSQFFFDAHHIVFDGESLDILMNDINSAYKGIPLNKEEYSEFDLALDEAELRQGEMFSEAKAYYGGLLEGRDMDCLPVNDLSSKDIGKQEINLDIPADRKRIDAFLSENRTTVNSVWIAAVGFTLTKFLNREDAVLTTVYNGRNETRIRRGVGMFVHTLPIVCEPYKHDSVIQYIRKTGEQIQKSMAYDLYSFAEIAHDYGVRADIMFVYEGKIAQGFKLGDEDIPRVQPLSLSGMKASILIAVSDTEEGFNIHVEYDGDKYEPWSIQSFIHSAANAFSGILNSETLESLDLLDEEDYRDIERWNETETEIPDDDIVTEFRQAAQKYPDNTAVIFKETRLTYRQVDEITDRIAVELAGRGIQKGKVVSILINRSENMVLSVLGVLKTGAAYQPLDPSYPSDRLLFMIKDADAAALIAEKELPEKIPGCKLPVLYTEEFGSLTAKEAELPTPEGDDLFILLYTSGTTGVPKGVMLNHRNLVNFCAWYRRFYDLKPEHAVAAYAGFGFDVNMMDLYPALTTGAAVCIVPDELRMNLDQVEKYFEANRVTHAFMTTQVCRMFACENDRSSLKYLSCGGEKLVPLEPPAGYLLFNGYGPSECTVYASIHRVDKLYYRIPIGKPLDNYKLYVADLQGRQLPKGALGELWISGYGVGMGYLNQKEKTAQVFIRNPFTNRKGYETVYRSGDIVRRLPDGSIDFIGRNDGQVKIRGFRIELGEVETAIRSFEGITDVTVQAFDLESGGKYLAAYITADSKIDIEALKEHIKADKPAYMVPASIMQIDAIPLNQNQKVNKQALPKPTFTDERKEYAAPANEVEKAFCEAYQNILGIERVSANDNFFEIGGTSLTAAKIVVFALNHGLQISYQDIFAHPTPIELSEYIKGNKQPATRKEEIPEEDAERTSLQYNVTAYVDEIRPERDPGRILLTGATGFLGIHILKELLDEQRDTMILVRGKDTDPVSRIKNLLMYYFDSPFIESLTRYVTVINADVTDESLAHILKDCEFDTIINAAAVVKHFANDDSIERVNVGGVKNLIEIAKQHKARLVQTSTLSVAGENVGCKFPDNYRMKENQLYFGQDLSNKYVHSKFKAEEAILTAIEQDDLDAKIIRLGNLMGRQRDGEFQINSDTNAFMRNLQAYVALGKFPVSSLDKSVDFSPIDETAKTVLLLAQTPSKFTVFHSLNSHAVQMGDVIDAMDQAGLHIEKVNDPEFMAAVREAMQDEKKSVTVSSLLSYASSDNLTHEFIQPDSSYTVKALYRLGYRWPITDFAYLIKAINALESLDFFEK